MCGFAGVVREDGRGVQPKMLGRMGAAVRHRGPDGYGFYLGQRVGLVHVRLSVIDLEGGAQPLTNERGDVIVVFNGEIYNYVELRQQLKAMGHQFRTQSDTEVLVHGYEQWGEALLEQLNGQFAFAIYDRRAEQVLLARDRFGIRPLFYAQLPGSLYFGSEIKALLASGAIGTRPDPRGLDQVFTFWGAIPPRTVFEGIQSMEPGCYAVHRNGQLSIRRYYEPAYASGRYEASDALEQLDDLMRSSVALRMRADVPVGGYLSGGLDSSLVCSLARQVTGSDLRTFSVTFDDPALDERVAQGSIAQALGSEHVSRHVALDEIRECFATAVWHLETPVLRTSPVPLILLSRLARQHGIMVVLTGVGADEVFWGYDLLKEVAVRRFCLRQPDSKIRPLLFDRLYPYLARDPRSATQWRKFFLGAGAADDPLFSHQPRMNLATWIRGFYAAGFSEALGEVDTAEELRSRLPGEFARWSALEQASYLELVTLLSPYLLSSQGDRVAMAHGVETRMPFLDHRVFEFAAALPERSKLQGLREKAILRRWAKDIVPPSVENRPKQPYRAPDVPAFFDHGAPEYVADALSETAIANAGVWDSESVCGLVRRCEAGRPMGVREGQALVGILSTQLWYRAFVEDTSTPCSLSVSGADVTIYDDAALQAGGGERNG